MAIYLRNSANVKPRLWGSPADIQYAVNKNAEKIYGINSDNLVLAIPSWEPAGDRLNDYSRYSNHGIFPTAVIPKRTVMGTYHNTTRGIAIGKTTAAPPELAFSGVMPITIMQYLDGREAAADDWSFAQSAEKVLRKNAVSKAEFILNSFSSNDRVASVANFPSTNCIIAGIFDGTNIRINVNNVEKSLVPTGSYANPAAPLCIGAAAYASETNSWLGEIYSTNIFNIGLSANQVALFNDRPWGLYEPVSRPVYFFQSAVVGPTIKTVTDIGGGLDILGRLAVSLNLSDSGLGSDIMGGLGAQLDLSDIGGGSDNISQILANLDILDFGQGTDVIPQILITLTIADSGLGTDEISKTIAGAYKAITDIAQGTDTISSILVSLSVMETGQGTESILISILLNIADVGLGTDIVSNYIFSSISDMASGVEEVSNISVNVPISDTSSGLDAPSQILVTLSISDSGLGIDLISILESLTKIVADSGSGLDSVGSVSVIIPISDSGTGLDTLSALQILLSVLESGHGVETIIRTSPSLPRKMIITFSAKKAGITSTAKKAGITFN